MLDCINRGALNDAVADGSDAVAAQYDATFRSRRCAIEDQLLARRLRRFLRGADDWVLDIGCGTGAVLAFIGGDPRRYVGVDISPAMVERAEAAHPSAHFIHASAEAMPFCDARFTAAVSTFSALSYVAAPLQAVGELHRVLRPGGRCLVMVYAPRWYRRNAAVLDDLHLDLAPAAWTDWQARARFTRAGFTDVRVSAFSALPTPLLALEDRMQPLARRWPMAGRYLVIEARKP
jgi:ubiquinone/menaquinone biosynthesis C-methylase UbiE